MSCYMIYFCVRTPGYAMNIYEINKGQDSIETKHWCTSTKSGTAFCQEHLTWGVFVSNIKWSGVPFSWQLSPTRTQEQDQNPPFSHLAQGWNMMQLFQLISAMKFTSDAHAKVFWWFHLTNPFWQFKIKTTRLWVFDWNQHLTTQNDKDQTWLFSLALIRGSSGSESAVSIQFFYGRLWPLPLDAPPAFTPLSLRSLWSSMSISSTRWTKSDRGH